MIEIDVLYTKDYLIWWLTNNELTYTQCHQCNSEAVILADKIIEAAIHHWQGAFKKHGYFCRWHPFEGDRPLKFMFIVAEEEQAELNAKRLWNMDLSHIKNDVINADRTKLYRMIQKLAQHSQKPNE